jgi:hypothetical protein
MLILVMLAAAAAPVPMLKPGLWETGKERVCRPASPLWGEDQNRLPCGRVKGGGREARYKCMLPDGSDYKVGFRWEGDPVERFTRTSDVPGVDGSGRRGRATIESRWVGPCEGEAGGAK